MRLREYNSGLVRGLLFGTVITIATGYTFFKIGYYLRYEEENAYNRKITDINTRLNWKRNHPTTQSQPASKFSNPELERMADETSKEFFERGGK